MRKIRKAFALIVTIVMVLSLAACATDNNGRDGTEGGATPEVANEGGKTMTVLLAEEPGSEDSFGLALKAWEADTGNTAEIMVISYDDQLTKFPAMAKNNDLPDLIATTRLHQLYPEEFIDMNSVMDTSIFNESALNIVGKDYVSDKITGLPLQFTTTSMFYNIDAFDKAGLIAPTIDKPWSIDELYANSKILQDKGGVKYGLAADVSRARYDILMYANGGSLVEKDKDTFKVSVNSAKNVATLEKFIKANIDGVMPQAIWAGGTTDNPADYFKNGDVGILLSGSWNYNSFITDITNFKFGTMPTLKGEVSSAAIIGGSALAVPEHAKNKDLAVSFLEWLYTKENFQSYLNNDKGLSALSQLVYEPADEKAAADFAVLQSEVSAVTDTFIVDESSAWRNFKDNEYRDYIKRAVSGEMTAKEALDTFANELAESSGWKIAK